MIEHFLPQYWLSLLLDEVKKTPIGKYIDYTDDFQNWGDSTWTLNGHVTADHGMYFNFFVNSVDKLQKSDTTEARKALSSAVYSIEKDICNYIAACYRPDDMPLPKKCRVLLSIPRIRAYQPEKGFCEGIQGLVLCGFQKIGDEKHDLKPRPYQPD